MRCQDIDVSGVAAAAVTLKDELDGIIGRLGQCQQELVAAEARLDLEREEANAEREALRQERWAT